MKTQALLLNLLLIGTAFGENAVPVAKADFNPSVDGVVEEVKQEREQKRFEVNDFTPEQIVALNVQVNNALNSLRHVVYAAENKTWDHESRRALNSFDEIMQILGTPRWYYYEGFAEKKSPLDSFSELLSLVRGSFDSFELNPAVREHLISNIIKAANKLKAMYNCAQDAQYIYDSTEFSLEFKLGMAIRVFFDKYPFFSLQAQKVFVRFAPIMGGSKPAEALGLDTMRRA